MAKTVRKDTVRKKVADTVGKVYAAIQTRDKWTKGEYESPAYDEDDNVVGTSFCLVGALNHIDGEYEEQATQALAAKILTKSDVQLRIDEDAWDKYSLEDVVIEFNDHKERTHRQVLSLLQRTKKAVLEGHLDFAIFPTLPRSEKN